MAIFQDTYSRARRNARKVVIGTTIVVAGVVVAAPWGSGGGSSGTANLWVNATGVTSGCARSSVPAAYDPTKDCSWTQAYTAAASGDNVLVKGGSYGNVTFPANRSGSPAVTYTPAVGETVTVGNFENGRITGCSPGGADNQTFNGPITATTFRSDCTDGVTVNDWDVNAGGIASQMFHAESVTNFTLKDSDVHNSCAQGGTGGQMYISGSGFLIDHNNLYDARLCDGSTHTECVYATSVSNMTFRRNRLWNCNAEGVFVTGSSTAANWTVENNVFELVTGSAANLNSALAFRTGGAPSPYPTNFLLRYNTFISGMQAPDSTASASGAIYGNVFMRSPPCGWGSITYSYNVTPTGTSNCGGTGAASFSSASILAGFTNPNTTQGNGSAYTPAGDYTLLTGSPLKDIGNPSAFPALDILGHARPFNTTPDVGAYEYGAT